MKHFFQLLTALSLAFIAVSCGGGNTKPELRSASIDSIYPSIVIPGTLLVVTGEGFGNTPAGASIGAVEITEFLAWENNTVAFRVPEGVKSGDTVKIGKSVSPASIDLAPKGSLRVIWLVDTAKLEDVFAKSFKEYNVTEAPALGLPLYLKGQWAKTVGNVGQYDQGWAGGAKVRMVKLPGGDVWTSECVYTPEAQLTMEGKPMLFAFEDVSEGDRTISGFESDAAAMLKLEWAKADSVTDVSSDPGVMISAASKDFVAASNAIILAFPK